MTTIEESDDSSVDTESSPTPLELSDEDLPYFGNGPGPVPEEWFRLGSINLRDLKSYAG